MSVKGPQESCEPVADPTPPSLEIGVFTKEETLTSKTENLSSKKVCKYQFRCSDKVFIRNTRYRFVCSISLSLVESSS